MVSALTIHYSPITFHDSKNNRFSFGHDEHFVFDSVHTRRFAQALEWFFEWLVTQTETAVVHRHKRLGFELVERAHRFFRVHVHFARKRRIVSPDWQERDLDGESFATIF